MPSPRAPLQSFLWPKNTLKLALPKYLPQPAQATSLITKRLSACAILLPALAFLLTRGRIWEEAPYLRQLRKQTLIRVLV